MTETSPEDRNFIFLLGGLLGWFLVNGLIWLAMGKDAWDFGIPLFFGNLLAMIILLAVPSTRKIGQGILIAWAVNFILALILGAFFNGLCLIPFFSPNIFG